MKFKTEFALLVLLAVSSGWQAQAADPVSLVVLGTAQDGGYPQAGCQKSCYKDAWASHSLRRFVSSIAVVDVKSSQRWLFDCTPDFKDQLRLLDAAVPSLSQEPLSGILLTHAHIGHYAGLIHLGREVMGSRGVPVYAMPRMKYFLESNGPWSQLVSLNQIKIQKITPGSRFSLSERVAVTAIPVPHRDEFSETVAFKIEGPNRSALFLPDIDKWDKWAVRIEDLISQVDFAFLDATFFDSGELKGRDMSEIPHPFVVESIERFKILPESERQKIHFIHLNHSNPLLQNGHPSRQRVVDAGHQIAKQGTSFEL